MSRLIVTAARSHSSWIEDDEVRQTRITRDIHEVLFGGTEREIQERRRVDDPSERPFNALGQAERDALTEFRNHLYDTAQALGGYEWVEALRGARVTRGR